MIAAGAVLPVSTPSPAGLPLDKLIHLCEYLLLAWCMVQVARTSGLPRTKTLTVAFLLPTSLGVLLEGIQHFLPYRSAEFLDVAANTMGTGLGLWVGMITPQRKW